MKEEINKKYRVIGCFLIQALTFIMKALIVWFLICVGLALLITFAMFFWGCIK